YRFKGAQQQKMGQRGLSQEGTGGHQGPALQTPSPRPPPPSEALAHLRGHRAAPYFRFPQPLLHQHHERVGRGGGRKTIPPSSPSFERDRAGPDLLPHL